MKNASDYEALLELVVEGVVSPDDLTKAIIFTNSIQKTLDIMTFLRENLPIACNHQVDIFHVLRLTRSKNRTLKWFRHGQIKILVATEAAGMVSTHYSLLHHS